MRLDIPESLKDVFNILEDAKNRMEFHGTDYPICGCERLDAAKWHLWDKYMRTGK